MDAEPTKGNLQMNLLTTRLFTPLRMWALAVFLSLPTMASAQEVDCSTLSDLACVSSPQCMFTAGYECVAPWDNCQIGFRQAILGADGMRIDTSRQQETIDQCHSQTGCAYIPVGPCYCPPDVDCICGGGEPPNCLQELAGEFTPPVGEFVVVTARAASGVASTAGMGSVSEIIGTSIRLTENSLEINELGCDGWEIRQVDAPVNADDPLLSDVMTGPVDSADPNSDHRIMAGWEYACEGEVFIDLLQVDGRVLVAPWENGAVNLILERPMTKPQITRMQAALKDVKFLDQEPSGELDEATMQAVGFWAEYRSSADDPYRFLRTAITENLFDGMGVFKTE